MVELTTNPNDLVYKVRIQFTGFVCEFYPKESFRRYEGNLVN